MRLKHVLFIIFFFVFTSVFAQDRTSHIFAGLGSTLQTTYTATVTTAVTSGQACAEYERINVYMNIATIVSSGIVKASIEYSHDGTNWFKPYDIDPTVASFATSVLSYYQGIGTAQGYYLVFPLAGAYFRVRVTYVSGTSVAIDAVTIEGKS